MNQAKLMAMSEDGKHRNDLFSKSIRAGKRTYFFDVKSTKGNDLYITITESKRRYADDGRQHYEKHKLFLYKEDFEKFAEGLQETIERVDALRNSDHYDEDLESYTATGGREEGHLAAESDGLDEESSSPRKTYTNIDFDDLNEA